MDERNGSISWSVQRWSFVIKFRFVGSDFVYFELWNVNETPDDFIQRSFSASGDYISNFTIELFSDFTHLFPPHEMQRNFVFAVYINAIQFNYTVANEFCWNQQHKLGQFVSMGVSAWWTWHFILLFLRFETIFNRKVLALKAPGMKNVFSFCVFRIIYVENNATSVIKLLPQQCVLSYVLRLFFLHYYELVLSVGFVNKCFCCKLWSGVFLVPHGLEVLEKQ